MKGMSSVRSRENKSYHAGRSCIRTGAVNRKIRLMGPEDVGGEANIKVLNRVEGGQ